ncbi:MAG TPA: 30S ribosomal protein S7 [Vicinamibacterales bacterium]|nr:30S ribosomal protein S7 [Vicinamibacterales bacterium]
MPRRREIPKRDVPADPLYNSSLVTKFINTVMRDGKRSTAEQIMYGSLKIIQEKTGDDPLKVFKKAVENVKPALEVKSRRVGGSNYQVPVEVNPNRRLSLSIRWLVGYARSRGDGKTMQEKLANELLDAANLRGGAVKKREDTHRMAEANKAFAHYRW